IGAPDASPSLRAALFDPEWPVRAMAAKALGRIHDVESIPGLRAALMDRDWWVRANAAVALRRLGPSGIDALEGALADEDPYARHQACLMLEEAGVLDRRVAQLVAPGSAGVAAEWVVARFVESGLTGRLREIAATQADERVRLEVARLLGAPAAAESAR
ncbi:MAG TPA: HEAT repeat domain-containing protein, partial [Candidatus Polarisedimenticolaceae bacterium]|nr:HEAT repeat domain-containing protein [Candidatus Polarisedimenticolaceae bacterium]